MGAWGGLCVFDHARFVSVVAPALRGGEDHPLIRESLAVLRTRDRYARSDFRGLGRWALSCDSQLFGSSLGRDFLVCDGEIAVETPRAGTRWGYEDVVELFELLVTRYTISHYANFGLAFNAVTDLFPEDFMLEAPTQALIGALDSVGRYWAVGSGGYGEGIQGWLDWSDTARLWLALSRRAPFTAELHETYANYPDTAQRDRHLKRLAKFMEILELARVEGKGVLWARDLRLLYGGPGLFAEHESWPIELL